MSIFNDYESRRIEKRKAVDDDIRNAGKQIYNHTTKATTKGINYLIDKTPDLSKTSKPRKYNVEKTARGRNIFSP